MSVWNADPSTSMAGMLSPQDRLMSIFAGLSRAGARMADPRLGKGQALAAGLGGIGEGMSEANQQALMQKLLGLKFTKAKQEADDDSALAGMLGGGAPAAPSADGAPAAPSADGAPPASSSMTAPGGIAASMLKNPAFAQIMLRRYGPQGLAALQKEPKAPETVDGFDPKTGQKIRYQYNPQSGRYDIPVGGAQVEVDKLQLGPDGKAAFLPGVVDSLAGKEGAVVTAKERAGLPFEGPKAMARVPAAIAEARGKAPIEISTANAKNYNLGPGEVRMPGSPLGTLPGQNDLLRNAPKIGQAPAPMPGPPPGLAPGGGAPMPQPPAGLVKPNAAPMPQPPASMAGDPLAQASPEDLQRIANDPNYPAEPAMREAAKARLKETATSLYAQTEGQGPKPIAVSPNPPPGSPERAESAKYGTQLAERFNDVQTAARGASQTVDNVRLVRAMPSEGTGKFGPAREIIGGYLKELGYNGDITKTATDLQSLNAVASNFVLGKQLEQKGVQTESDAKRMEKTFTSIENTPEANDFILRVVNAQALRQMEQADYYSNHRQTTGSLDGAEEKWREHIRQTPLIQSRRSDGKAVFFDEFAQAARRVDPNMTFDQILAEWRKGGR